MSIEAVLSAYQQKTKKKNKKEKLKRKPQPPNLLFFDFPVGLAVGVDDERDAAHEEEPDD